MWNGTILHVTHLTLDKTMAKLLRIGIVGCGAIGSSLAETIAKDFSGQAALAAVYDIDNAKSGNLSRRFSKTKNIAASSIRELIRKCDLVIEASSSKCSWEISREAVRNGRDIMVMSVGGIAGYLHRLASLAEKSGAKVYIPTGAISGIDALKAARCGKIKKVTLSTYKNPRSFQGVRYAKENKIELNKIKKDTILFSGSAKEAIRLFPQNINVAAVLSIAGIGQDKTRVRIIASPSTNKNIHQVEIESSAGKIVTRTENVLHPDNPKTSYLAYLSAVATLRQIFTPVKVGT